MLNINLGLRNQFGFFDKLQLSQVLLPSPELSTYEIIESILKLNDLDKALGQL